MTQPPDSQPGRGASTLAAMLRPARLRRELTGFGLQQVTNILYPLAVLPIVARLLNPDGFGALVFFQSLGTWGGITIIYGLDIVGARALLTEPSDQSRIAGSLWSAQIAVAVLLLAVLVLALPFVRFFAEHPELLALAWLSALFQSLVPHWFFRARQRMQTLATLEVMPKLASLPALAAALFLAPHPATAMVVFVLTHLTTLSLAARIALKDLGPVRLSPAGIGRRLRDGFPIFFSNMAYQVNAMGSIVVLGLFAAPAAVGFYGAAERIIRAATSLLSVVPQALYPVMVAIFHVDDGRADRMIRLSILAVATGGVLGGGAIWILAPWAVPLVFGDDFGPAAPLLQMMLALPLVYAISHVIGLQGLVAGGMAGRAALVVGIGAAVNLALAGLLAPRYGPEGMIVAVFGGALVVLIGVAIAFRARRRAAPAKMEGTG